MKLMTLDLATNVGWAVADPAAVDTWPAGLDLEGACGPFDGVRYGSHKIGAFSLPHGRFYILFAEWLNAMLDLENPTHLVFEAPLPRGNKAGIEAGRRGLGLAAITDMIITKRGIRPYELPVATARKVFTGSGSTTEAKARVMATCRRRGWTPKDSDTADALAVLDASIHKFREMNRGRAA